MKLPTPEAERIARSYFAGFPDMPTGLFVKPRQYLPVQQGRTMEGCYACMVTHDVYVLMSIRVKDDKSVELVEDRRDVVRALLKERGVELSSNISNLHTASSFFERAISEEGAKFPGWIASIRMDAGEAHDAIATFIDARDQRIDVPVIVFRTRSEKAKFFASFNGNPPSRVSVVLPKEATTRDVRGRLVNALNRYRREHDSLVTAVKQ